MSDPNSGKHAYVGRHPVRDTGPRRQPHGGWLTLLLAPMALSLFTPLYNRIEPSLFGIPFFYWGQLAFVLLSIAVTALVYAATKPGR